MRPRNAMLIAAMMSIAQTGSASGGNLPDSFSGFGVFWEGQFEQTGPASLVSTAFDFQATALEEASNPETILGVDLSWENAGGAPQTAVLSESSGQWTYWSGEFASQADLEAAYPPSGNYSYDVEVDGLGVFSDTFAAPGSMWPSAVPEVLNFNALQALDPTHDFTLEFNGFMADASAEISSTFISIIESDKGFAWGPGVSIDPSDTSILIPADALEPNTDYYISIWYENRILDSNGDPFLGSFVNWENTLRTRVYFSTIPTPGSAAFGALSLILVVRRRRQG